VAKHRTPPWFILIFWPVVDKILRAIYRIKPLKPDGSSIISLDIRHYKGATKILNDGSKVKTGDKIIEIHLNNDWFKESRKLPMKAPQSAWQIMSCLEQDLRFLAQQIMNGMFEDVVALHALTLLHAGTKRLGFQIEEVPDNLWNKGAHFYMAGLMQIYRLRANDASRNKRRSLELKEVWLSKTALLEKYGSRHP